MSLIFPKFTSEPTNESSAVGSAVDRMVVAARAQSAANQKQLQQARAAEAKRQRAESLAAAAVLDSDFRRE